MTELISSIDCLSSRILTLIPATLVLYDCDGEMLDIRYPERQMSDTGNEPTVARLLSRETLRELPRIHAEQFRATGETGQSVRFVLRLKTEDGKRRFFEVFLCRLAEEERLLANIRNISDQSVAQIESEHLHAFFCEVLENVAIPITVKNADTDRYIFWSRKMEVFGRKAAEVVGETSDSFLPPHQAEAVREIDRKLGDGKHKQYRGNEKYVLNDGLEHTFTVTRTPFSFGEEKLILASALDISELKETQASLLHTKHELARKNMALYSALSLAKVIPWGCDLRNRTFYCDYNAYHPENAPGPDERGRYVIRMERYFASIHPDFRAEAIRMIDELADGTRKEFHETYLIHWFNQREWEWVQVQCLVAGHDAEGRPETLLGSAQRITEQKQTELALRQAKEDLAIKNATLRSALSIAQVVPWIGDLDKERFFCDYAAYHPRNATSPDAEGHYVQPFEEFFERIHPDYRTRIFERFRDVIEGRAPEFRETYPLHWFDEEEYDWVEFLSSIPECGPDGLPRQLIGSARVVTEEKRMETSLRRAKEQAERDNTLKTAFLANMSHEIRTPLNAIVGFSELLSHAETDEEKQEYMTIIRNSNALLTQLVGDILDLSKIEAGTLEFVFADYDLNALMTELEQTARMKVGNPSIEVACTDRLPECTIRTDRGRLVQVLHNFINNAAKFTERGHIHFGYRRHPDGRWYFYVEDTGCGIPAEKREQVFERFVKLNDGKERGTGLGLAISKSIVERLGGEIGVFSTEGQGSTFWFLLPSGSVIRPGSERVTNSPPAMCPESGTLTILVAEDDPANYKLFEAMLRKKYNLLHAWNGRQAVGMFREHRPELILMDIRMPLMNGYEATAAIRKLSPNVPIIAVTAFAYPEDLRRILSHGFDGCLPKPVSNSDLQREIQGLCPCIKRSE